MPAEIEPFLRWTNTDVRVSAYAAVGIGTPVPEIVAPGAMKRYAPFRLDQDDQVVPVLPDYVAYLWNLVYDDLPEDVSGFFGGLLSGLCLEGATVSWLAFEGGFHYHYLLSPDPAAGVYGVCVCGEQPTLALTAKDRQAKEWEKALAHARARLGLRG